MDAHPSVIWYFIGLWCTVQANSVKRLKKKRFSHFEKSQKKTIKKKSKKKAKKKKKQTKKQKKANEKAIKKQ